MWELKLDQELNKWLTKPFCTLTGELMGDLTVISVSVPGPVLVAVWHVLHNIGPGPVPGPGPIQALSE